VEHYANVIEMDEDGKVINAKYAEKRATDYLRSYCDPNFKVSPGIRRLGNCSLLKTQ
jgi:hypothetical protein